MAKVISKLGVKEKNNLADVHSVPAEKPKLNQGVKLIGFYAGNK